MSETIEIQGGADPYATAAVMAAVQAVLEEDFGSNPTESLSQGAWVMAGRPRSVRGPRRDLRGITTSAAEDGKSAEEA